MREVVLVGACRTAVGKFGGSLKDIPAVEFGALVIREALQRAGIKPEMVDEVILGCVLTGALGQNPARQAMLKATHTKDAPWTLVDFNDQKLGRLSLIRDLLDRLPDTRIDAPAITFPPLASPPAREHYGALEPIPAFKV